MDWSIGSKFIESDPIDNHFGGPSHFLSTHFLLRSIKNKLIENSVRNPIK